MEAQFSPYLSEDAIQEEALQLAIKRAAEEDTARQEEEYVAKVDSSKKKAGKRRKSLAVPMPAATSPLVASGSSLAPSCPSSRSVHSDMRSKHQPEHG